MNAQLKVGLPHNPSPADPTRCALADARAALSEHDELLLLKQWLAETGHEAAAEAFVCSWLEAYA